MESAISKYFFNKSLLSLAGDLSNQGYFANFRDELTYQNELEDAGLFDDGTNGITAFIQRAFIDFNNLLHDSCKIKLMVLTKSSAAINDIVRIPVTPSLYIDLFEISGCYLLRKSILSSYDLYKEDNQDGLTAVEAYAFDSYNDLRNKLYDILDTIKDSKKHARHNLDAFVADLKESGYCLHYVDLYSEIKPDEYAYNSYMYRFLPEINEYLSQTLFTVKAKDVLGIYNIYIFGGIEYILDIYAINSFYALRMTKSDKTGLLRTIEIELAEDYASALNKAKAMISPLLVP